MDSHLSTKLKIRQQAQLINNIIRKILFIRMTYMVFLFQAKKEFPQK